VVCEIDDADSAGDAGSSMGTADRFRVSLLFKYCERPSLLAPGTSVVPLWTASTPGAGALSSVAPPPVMAASPIAEAAGGGTEFPQAGRGHDNAGLSNGEAS